MLKISDFKNLIETHLRTLEVPKQPKGLYSPIYYGLSMGGKRLRPSLCLASAAMFGDYTPALEPACGLEVFHNFTLLHDDLMDHADLRRNQPTVHKKWDANTAILSGDAMLIKAYELISRSPVGTLPQVLDVFSQTATEVCEGQQYDMEFEERDDVTVDQYLEMIRLKTAVLIGGSMKIGAIIGGASPEDCNALYNFGQDIGLAFQLQDDWLDVFGTQKEFGKVIGGDILANKKTFLLISALSRLEGGKKGELLDWLQRKEYDAEEKIAAVTALFEQAGVSDLLCQTRNRLFNDSLVQLSKIGGHQEVKQMIEDFSCNLMERAR
jgi:geranylgeranyl diphosphate synthase type II